MNTTANADYLLKYSLLTVDMTVKKLKKASIKYLLHILNPNIEKVEITADHCVISKITLDGTLMMFSQGLNSTRVQMPTNYQVDEHSIMEIHYTTQVDGPWTLCAGNSIPSLQGYGDFAVHEVKLVTHDANDYKLSDVQILSKTPLPQKFVYHYVRTNQGASIVLG